MSQEFERAKFFPSLTIVWMGTINCPATENVAKATSIGCTFKFDFKVKWQRGLLIASKRNIHLLYYTRRHKWRFPQWVLADIRWNNTGRIEIGNFP